LAAAQVGKHNGKRESFGHSLAVDPWGTILADAGGAKSTSEVDASPSIVTCEIDLEAIDSIRQRMPIGMHRDNSKFS
jgi:predicted amidohydrolase